MVFSFHCVLEKMDCGHSIVSYITIVIKLHCSSGFYKIRMKHCITEMKLVILSYLTANVASIGPCNRLNKLINFYYQPNLPRCTTCACKNQMNFGLCKALSRREWYLLHSQCPLDAVNGKGTNWPNSIDCKTYNRC